MADDNADKTSSPNHSFKPGFHTPVRASAIGMYLVLAALFMLFAAGILGYVIIRLTARHKYPDLTLDIPQPLWISTLIVVLGSVTIQFAVAELRREHQREFRRWLLVTMGVAVAFIIVQGPAMVMLIASQRKLQNHNLALYILILVLIVLHALHVVGGIVALGWTNSRARDGAYDHENYHPVGRVALYWHFLDAVWLVMFFTFLLMG